MSKWNEQELRKNRKPHLVCELSNWLVSRRVAIDFLFFFFWWIEYLGSGRSGRSGRGAAITVIARRIAAAVVDGPFESTHAVHFAFTHRLFNSIRFLQFNNWISLLVENKRGDWWLINKKLVTAFSLLAGESVKLFLKVRKKFAFARGASLSTFPVAERRTTVRELFILWRKYTLKWRCKNAPFILILLLRRKWKAERNGAERGIKKRGKLNVGRRLIPCCIIEWQFIKLLRLRGPTIFTIN